MKDRSALLLLSGSAEAQALRPDLMRLPQRLHVLAAERPRNAGTGPETGVELRRFAHAQAMADYLHHHDIGAILDAGHAFDGQQAAQAHGAAALLGLPCLSLRRLLWETGARPHWHRVAAIAEALPLIPRGARVFSATGWASLPEYADFPGSMLLLRQTRRHDRPPPFDFVTPVFGSPPFSVTEEMALFTKLQVDVLICRNLGGQASRSKLDAAAALDLTVLLVDPPPLPPGAPVVHTTAEALAWARAL